MFVQHGMDNVCSAWDGQCLFSMGLTMFVQHGIDNVCPAWD